MVSHQQRRCEEGGAEKQATTRSDSGFTGETVIMAGEVSHIRLVRLGKLVEL